MSSTGLEVDHELDGHDPAALLSPCFSSTISNPCRYCIINLANVLVLVVPHGGSVMYEPDVSGGVIQLSVIGESSNVGFLLVSAVLAIFCSVCAKV